MGDYEKTFGLEGKLLLYAAVEIFSTTTSRGVPSPTLGGERKWDEGRKGEGGGINNMYYWMTDKMYLRCYPESGCSVVISTTKTAIP